ncbi:MAG: sigma-54 interaction domain-containing protein [Candidatus Aminicenantaceae bacterium]
MSNSSPLSIIKLLDLIKEEIRADYVSVLLINGNNQIIYKQSRQTNGSQSHKDYLDIAEKVLKEKQLIFVDGMNEPMNKGKKVLCLPLLFENKAGGVLYLERHSRYGMFSSEQVEIFVEFSKPICTLLKIRSGFKFIKEKYKDYSWSMLVGKSALFSQVLDLIEKVKDSKAPVFIYGESGTGKELVARAIHKGGSRERGQFIAVNCGAIPDYLLESELFGFTKGAFTGAVRSKSGLIEEATGGTLFLDEIGDLPLKLQAKLLRFLQDKEIRRIGENKARYVDVRFLSATNKNIEKEVEAKNFREDLYYRLNIIKIKIPPLRERKEDILLLLNHFVEKYGKEMNREKVHFTPQALDILVNYSWPGNVRELENEVQKCLIISGNDSIIKHEFISSNIRKKASNHFPHTYDFCKARMEFEKRFINKALARFDYNKTQTANQLGLSRQGLFKLIKKYGIQVPG